MSQPPYELNTGDEDVELLKYPPDPRSGDQGAMYALRAHGIAVLIYLDVNGQPYVTVDRDDDADEWTPYTVQVEGSSTSVDAQGRLS